MIEITPRHVLLNVLVDMPEFHLSKLKEFHHLFYKFLKNKKNIEDVYIDIVTDYVYATIDDTPGLFQRTGEVVRRTPGNDMMFTRAFLNKYTNRAFPKEVREALQRACETLAETHYENG
jgi:hypothetical protein